MVLLGWVRVGWPCSASALVVAVLEIVLGLRWLIPKAGSGDAARRRLERTARVSVGGAGVLAGCVMQRARVG